MTDVPLQRRIAGYAVHIYTASGLLFAFLAAFELTREAPDPRLVFLWLIVAVLIDATDGPLARLAQVKHTAPRIDGRTIDDIVDFLTFTFIPLMLIARMGWVPEPALLFVGPPLVASVLGFANVGAKDESGGFFIGFPSYWNIVALYIGVAAAQGLHILNGIALLVLAVATVTPIGFIYPNLAPPRWKPAILIGAYVWLAMIVPILYYFPHPPPWIVALSLIYPLFYVVVSLAVWSRSRRR